jgi:hypothetical protein
LGAESKFGRIGEGVRFLIRNPIYDLGDKKSVHAKWSRMIHLSPLVSYSANCYILHSDGCLKDSSFAARIKKGVRNMRSTFNILFYVNKSKEKGGTTRLSVSGRVPWCGACDG